MIIILFENSFWPGSPESKQGVSLWVLASLRAALPSPTFRHDVTARCPSEPRLILARSVLMPRTIGRVMVMSGVGRRRLYFFEIHMSTMSALFNSMIMRILCSGGVFIMVVSLSSCLSWQCVRVSFKRVPEHDTVSYCPAFGYKPMSWFNVNTMCSLKIGCLKWE